MWRAILIGMRLIFFSSLARRLRLAALALACMAGTGAHACVICAPSDTQNNLVQRLGSADAAVLVDLATVTAQEPLVWTVQDIIKGPLPPGAALHSGLRLSAPDSAAVAEVALKTGAVAGNTSHLLLYYAASASWRSAGPLSRERAAWARRLAAMPVASAGAAANVAMDWPKRLAALAPDLESPEPLVAQTTYEEISVAPYAAMRSLKPYLLAAELTTWLDQPALTARRPLYALLLGMAGTAADAHALEARILASGRRDTLASLSALLAAYLELRGAQGLPWIQHHFLEDTQRSDDQLQAALQALRIHAEDGTRVTQAQVVQAYASFIQHNPARAGFAAPDLNKWERWEFTPAFVEILRSKASRVFSARYGIIFYLMRSPDPRAKEGLEALHAQGIL